MTFRPGVKLDPSRVKDGRRHGSVTRRSDGPVRPPKAPAKGGGKVAKR